MKLCNLEAGKAWRHIEGLSQKLLRRKIHFEVLSSASISPPKILILIGNGSPDDLAIAILSFKFDGEDFAWLVRPKIGRNIAALQSLPILLDSHTGSILALLDQEREEIQEFLLKTKETLLREGLEVSEEKGEGRLRALSCKYHERAFNLILLINGLDRPYTIHTIEDHLLEAGELFLGKEKVEELLQKAENHPKKAWGSLERGSQDEVFVRLCQLERADLHKLFPQHCEAFRLLGE